MRRTTAIRLARPLQKASVAGRGWRRARAPARLAGLRYVPRLRLRPVEEAPVANIVRDPGGHPKAIVSDLSKPNPLAVCGPFGEPRSRSIRITKRTAPAAIAAPATCRKSKPKASRRRGPQPHFPLHHTRYDGPVQDSEPMHVVQPGQIRRLGDRNLAAVARSVLPGARMSEDSPRNLCNVAQRI